jgi:hypothetical protein
MELWWRHISPIAETWAYCLLRNHFHAVVFTRNREDLTGLTRTQATQNVRGDKGITPSDSRGDVARRHQLSPRNPSRASFPNDESMPINKLYEFGRRFVLPSLKYTSFPPIFQAMPDFHWGFLKLGVQELRRGEQCRSGILPSAWRGT